MCIMMLIVTIINIIFACTVIQCCLSYQNVEALGKTKYKPKTGLTNTTAVRKDGSFLFTPVPLTAITLKNEFLSVENKF